MLAIPYEAQWAESGRSGGPKSGSVLRSRRRWYAVQFLQGGLTAGRLHDLAVCARYRGRNGRFFALGGLLYFTNVLGQGHDPAVVQLDQAFFGSGQDAEGEEPTIAAALSGAYSDVVQTDGGQTSLEDLYRVPPPPAS